MTARATPAAVVTLLLVFAPVAAQQPQLLTVAESSGFRATGRHADALEFCRRLEKLSPLVRVSDIGTSAQGRTLPLLILADPPVSNPPQAAASGKLVVLAVGAIHGGEVDGKEGLLMLARDLATAKDKSLFKDLIILIVPLLNADGAEKIDKGNRTSQNGPADGVGERASSQGFDLNRDFVKLETPEVRALARLLRKWDPMLVIDTHTTNGSYHRLGITYDGPRGPSEAKLSAYVADKLLPDAGKRLEQLGGQKSFFYGIMSKDRTRWDTYPAQPRYGIQYVGLRGRAAVLSESYSYAPYKDRVLASRDFVRACLEHANANRGTLTKVLADARKPADTVAIRHKAAAWPKPVTIPGYVEKVQDGKLRPTDEKRDYQVQFLGATEPTLTVKRPHAYLYPASYTAVTENLQRHGIAVEELREDVELDVQAYRVDKLTRVAKPYQKHHLVTVEATARKESRRFPAGTQLVRTDGPLGRLTCYLLEPQSEDGLTTWNFFDAGLEAGRDAPVVRLPAAAPVLAGAVRPLAEERARNRPVTAETISAGGVPVNFSGNPVSGLTWLDADHYLQVKSGRLHKVHAATGRAVPFHDADRLDAALAKVPKLGRFNADRIARGTNFRMNAQKTAFFFEYENDLYYAKFDGSAAARLTKAAGEEELPSISPCGRYVAFVRQHNLYVVDVATQKERQLTADGSELISSGKADWVYFEEIFNRSWKAYWWAPDGSHLAFMRFDDTGVPKFTVVDHTQRQQTPEITAYPKAGAPNPTVKLGMVSVTGGPVRWADLGGYNAKSMLISRVGWLPDSQTAYCYIQDRAQTWLDFCTVPHDGGKPAKLFRETTKAWVEDLGEAHFLKDGTFLIASERSGWKHLYHHAADGKLLRPLTSGEWEVRNVYLVDEASGFVYLSGTRDCHIANNLYRVSLKSGSVERLTKRFGDHKLNVGPGGKLFVSTVSDIGTPPKVYLHRGDGGDVRTLDTNPVYALEEYRMGKVEPVKIQTPDGFVMEGTLLKPVDFDAKKKYPIWFMTYGGPHAPTVKDAWSPGRMRDEMLAQMGFVVFRCDPRSASGKGAVSTWTCYRQLGVQELKDVEAAIKWVTSHPWADVKRVGMSGHSYGGFLTAYALTHSKLFAAGIAGAPVTDWRNYDSIYTERYMNTPQDNAKGYNATSVTKAAKDLHGRLLILHGLMDDNVHVQNAVELVDALQRADRDFEVMFYPRARHGLFGQHYQRLMVDFMKRALQPGE